MYFKETRMRRTYQRRRSSLRRVAQWDDPKVQEYFENLKKIAPAFNRGLHYFDNLFDEDSYAIGLWIGELDLNVWEAAKKEGLFEKAGFPKGEITAEGFYYYEYSPHSSIHIPDYDDAISRADWEKIFTHELFMSFVDAFASFGALFPSDPDYRPVKDLLIRIPKVADPDEFLHFIKWWQPNTYELDRDNPGWVRIFWD